MQKLTSIFKVVWRWKELANEYEYVYKVVGLSDMIERRSSNAEMSVAEMDVYCTLCTAIISYSQEAVDEHIRSLTHIINYAVCVWIVFLKSWVVIRF
ncbi:unnamed protein product [Anisakis simplex]|uniref:U1-type domain-containing protein n=1 Tax=Anisakis simplex TaxID=6269 RepID=A0A0M3JLE1_ANISI|nr:unnamed protein product [Anisakis simplex]